LKIAAKEATAPFLMMHSLVEQSHNNNNISANLKLFLSFFFLVVFVSLLNDDAHSHTHTTVVVVVIISFSQTWIGVAKAAFFHLPTVPCHCQNANELGAIFLV